MNHPLVVACACVLALQIAYAQYGGREQFELREGNCSRAITHDVVFQDHIHLARIPFESRNKTSSWHGDEKLYCILAVSGRNASNGSTVFIKNGGLNHSFVTLEFHSKKNHGLDYNVTLFGKSRR